MYLLVSYFKCEFLIFQIDYRFSITINDLSRISGTWTSSSISSVKKSTKAKNFPIWIVTFSSTPMRYLINLFVIYNVTVVSLSSPLSNLLQIEMSVRLIPTPISHKTLSNDSLPTIQKIEKLLEFFSFNGNIFCRIALHSYKRYKIGTLILLRKLCTYDNNFFKINIWESFSYYIWKFVGGYINKQS